MNLRTATLIVNRHITTKQDPDDVIYRKQWDESGRLKGWWVACHWNTNWNTKTVKFDITSGYTRVIGNLDEIPEYIKGKHQRV